MWEPVKLTNLEIGTKVKLASGETGEIIDNSRPTKYVVQINGVKGTRIFDAKYVEELKDSGSDEFSEWS